MVRLGPAYQGTSASSLPLLDRAYLPPHYAASIDPTLPIDRRRNKAYRPKKKFSEKWSSVIDDVN